MIYSYLSVSPDNISGGRGIFYYGVTMSVFSKEAQKLLELRKSNPELFTPELIEEIDNIFEDQEREQNIRLKKTNQDGLDIPSMLEILRPELFPAREKVKKRAT
jgi:hypothetical protein